MISRGANQRRDGIDSIEKAEVTVDVKVAEFLGYFGQGYSPSISRTLDGVSGHPVVGLITVTGKPHGDLMPAAEDVILRGKRFP
jgi:hypothetical protein